MEERTETLEWEDATGKFYLDLSTATKDILKYAPKDVAFLIMEKLPPRDLINLCTVKSKRMRELCKGFMTSHQYKKRWEDAFEVEIATITKEQLEKRSDLLLDEPPLILLEMCSMNKKILELCDDENFMHSYKNIWNDDIENFQYFRDDADPELVTRFFEIFEIDDDTIKEYVENLIYGGHRANLEKFLSLNPDYPVETDADTMLIEYGGKSGIESIYSSFEILLKYLDDRQLQRLQGVAVYRGVKGGLRKILEKEINARGLN
jgi:hypothetical protein